MVFMDLVSHRVEKKAANWQQKCFFDVLLMTFFSMKLYAHIWEMVLLIKNTVLNTFGYFWVFKKPNKMVFF